MPPQEDNIYQFPTLAARAAKAMADYKAGVADEIAGKGRAIRAVIEYGKALAEGKSDGKERRSNTAFGQWVKDNRLDVGKPWDSKEERSHAMKIAALLGTVPNTSFDACPYTRPTHIMKWYRKMHAPTPDTNEKPKRQPVSKKEDKPKKTETKTERGLKPHYREAEIIELFDKELTDKQIAKQLGMGSRAVRHVTDRIRVEREAVTKAKADKDATQADARATEDAALAKAEATFTEKSKLTLADAIRIHKARLDRTFEQTVNAEVIRRIAAANDSVRERLKRADQTILSFERERGKKGVFSKRQFKQMQILCHPDNSASEELRAELLQVLVKFETYLVNPEIKDA